MLSTELATKISASDADESEVIAMLFNDLPPGVKHIAAVSRNGQVMQVIEGKCTKRIDINC